MHESISRFDKFSSEFLKITTKSADLIAFELNHYQKRILQIIEEKEKKNQPIRLLILKARQMGISTFASGLIYHRTATNFYTKSMIVAHDDDSTTNLFEMSKRFYDFSPPWMKPRKRYSNRKELVFSEPDEKLRETSPGLLSSIEIDTARNLTAGRSGTVQNLHISELAFWKNAEKPMTGLMQAVPSKSSTMIIIESTANGMDGDGKLFYDMCQASMRRQNDFEFVFIPWFENPEYRIKCEKLEHTEYEAEIAARHKLTDSQIMWRRWKIKNDLHGDEMLFRQEFPCTPDEAFILSGRPVFDGDVLMNKIHAAEGIKFVEEEMVRIFDAPQPGRIYVIGADVAEGLEDGDFSTAFVMDKQFNQVARFYGHIAPDKFAHELVKLGTVYNKALLAPEINNHGHAVLAKIKDLGYSNVYSREDFSEVIQKLSPKLGWQTNTKTKQLMLDEFIAAFRDGVLNIKDIELLREMTRLSYEPDGNVILNSKDLTVSACIAIQALKQTPHEIDYKAFIPNIDVQGPPAPETFQQRMKRLSKNGERYFD